MARKRGNFNVPNNYEVIAKAPLDAKQLVKTYNELISPVTWEDSSGDVWLYNGAIVSVGEDPDPLKNGIYVLNNVSLYTAPSSWTKQGAFTGSTSMGENGLYGTTGIIKLGGYLTENTVLDGNDTYSFKMLNMDSIELSNISDISNININNGGIIFSHSGQTVNYNSISGLTYGGDYSMYYGNRSLVDKEYVDVNINNLSISSVTKSEYNQYTGATQSVLNELNYVANLSITGLTNGITKIGNHDGKLGGILTENTIISLSNNNMIITGGTGSSSSVILDNFKFVDGNQGINKILESDIDGNAKWVEAIEINILTGTTNGVKTVNGNVELGGIITKPIIFTDNRTTKVGLQYAADYSNNYTDRTLVDKEYVDNLLTGYTTTITANNGLTYTNDNIRLGGDLTGNTIINIDNHELTITGTTGSSSSVVLNKLRFVDGNQGENNVMQSDIDGNVKWVESIEVDLITGATNTGYFSGNTGGPIYRNILNETLHLRTLKSVDENALKITHDNNFIYLSASTTGGGGDVLIPKTYAELSVLKSTNALVSGQKYLLTDYATKHVISYSDPAEINTGSLEPLILTAANDHEFHAEVVSTVHASDIIHYRFDDDSCEDGTRNSETKKWDGGTLRHGWITYRKSTTNLLSTYFDWRNYKVRRWKLDCQAWVSGGSYSKRDLAKDSNGNIYVAKTNHTALTVSPRSNAVNWQLAVDLSLQDEGLFLSWTPEVSNFNIGGANSNNLIISNAVKGTDYDDYYTFCINSERYNGSGVITDDSNGSLVGEGFFNIEIGDLQFDYMGMALGSEVSHNNIFFMLDNGGSELSYRNNKIGSNCLNNTIGDSFQSNSIGDNFMNNTIGSEFQFNTIGSEFQFNTIGSVFMNNTIGNISRSNTIGNDFQNNTIGNNFQSNTIGNTFQYNTIADYFQSNTIGDFAQFNLIGNGFMSNLSIGDYFMSNTITNRFMSNSSIGDYFMNNTIGDFFKSNTIGNSFKYNTIGNDFQSNTIVHSFQSNTIGNSLQSNNFSTSTHVYAYYDCTIFRNADLTWRLSYYDASDVLTIVDATA